MGKRLREISQLTFCLRVVLFGEETDIVAQSEKPLEKRACLRLASCQVEAISQPERTWQKNSVASGQAIDALFLRPITHDKPVLDQIAFDRGKRAEKALVPGGQETDQGHHQDTGIHRFRSVGLSKRLLLRIVA